LFQIVPTVFAFLSIIVLVLALLFIAHKLTSAIFWSIMFGPAISAAVYSFVMGVVQGNLSQALEGLRFAPFFLFAIDSLFFAKGASYIFIYVGFAYLAFWTYYLGKFLLKHEHMWGLPMLPLAIFIIGLTLPNLRAQIASWVPSLSWLVLPFAGIPALVVLTVIPFLICYLIWRRS
jgi:hypothetical protein